MGPFDSLPFEFCRTAPLMTRIKSSSDKRRVISDLKFPPEASVNAFIPKNTILGRQRTHNLPRSDDVVEKIDFKNKDYFLYTLDIQNAYKNFPVCPMEWPLLTLKWQGRYYIENRLPFGSRNSSVTMQTLARAILHILSKHQITAWMYLDDLMVMSDSWQKAKDDVETVTKIFEKLGLPTVPSKAQGPSQEVIWIGILFNMTNFTLSVPQLKLEQVIQNIQCLYDRDTINVTEMQSIVGKIVHISKCIIPSRLFTSRILAAMRAAKEGIIKITPSIRKDFDWFINFAIAWNGTAQMNPRKINRVIETYYERPFIMAFDEQKCYICNTQYLNYALNDLQATVLNVSMAIDLLSNETDSEGQTIVTTNNHKAVKAYNIGNTREEALDMVVRANWFTYALSNKDYKIVLKDEKDQIFSKLLKAVKGPNHSQEVQKIMNSEQKAQIYPDIHVFNDYIHKLNYRSRDDKADAAGNITPV